MAMKCKKCGGIIPDVIFDKNLADPCKNHIKTNPDINIGRMYG